MAAAGKPFAARTIFASGISTGVGFGIGAALGPPLVPYTQDLTNVAWKLHPSKPLSPNIAATLALRGYWTTADGRGEAALTGLDGDRFAALVDSMSEPPTTGQLLELRNRDLIADGDLTRGLRQTGLRAEWRDRVAALRQVLVPVSDLVRMAVREVFNPAQRAALDLDREYPDALTPEAAKVGLSEQDARRYWAAHWELPSYEQGANMMFRGDLTPEAFAGLLKALDYAPTWRDKLANLARAIPPISDMTRFAVREVYDPAKRAALGLDAEYPDAFTAQAAKHGMAEADARDYWAAHWRLPSPEQGFRMLHRGEIELPELDGLLKALDYPTLWRDRLRNIAYLTPGRVDLRRMYAEGVIDRPRLKRGYLDLGYTEADAETLTTFAVKLATKQPDSQRQSHVERAQTQLWTTTHRAYLAGDASEADVRAKLPQAGVPADEIADVLAVWTHEREVIRQRLTAAQVKKAWAKAIGNPLTGAPWTRDDALDELLSRGWSPQDANTFLDE